MAFKIGSNTVIDSDGLSFSNFNKLSSTIATSTPPTFTGSEVADGASFGDFNSLGVGNNRVVVGEYGAVGGGTSYLFRLEDTITEISELDANGASQVYYGFACDIGSGRVVVGDYGFNAGQGAVYIYNLDGLFLKAIQASDKANGDNFGQDLAVGCGKIVVAAPNEDTTGTNAGSAYIFSLNGVEEKIIRSPISSSSYGSAVAVGNGRIAIGSQQEDSFTGAAYIYDLKGQFFKKLVPAEADSNDLFGYDISIGCGKIVVGAPGRSDGGQRKGAVYVFDLHGNEEFKLSPTTFTSNADMSSNYGATVSVNNNRISVGYAASDISGSSSKGRLYIYDLEGNLLEEFNPTDNFGDFVGKQVSICNGRLIATSSAVETAYAYNLNEGQDTYWENMLEGFADSDQI